MNKAIITAAALSLIASSVFAQPPQAPDDVRDDAQESRPDPREDRKAPIRELFVSIDENQDGRIEAFEIAKNSDVIVKALDKNGDGFISEDDFQKPKRHDSEAKPGEKFFPGSRGPAD